MSQENQPSRPPIVGNLCLEDYDSELALGASGGVRVFPSPADCVEGRLCARDCGMAEVVVTFRRIVPSDEFERTDSG